MCVRGLAASAPPLLDTCSPHHGTCVVQVHEIEKFLKEAQAREAAILGDARVIGDISRCEMVIGTFIVGRILIPYVVSYQRALPCHAPSAHACSHCCDHL